MTAHQNHSRINSLRRVRSYPTSHQLRSHSNRSACGSAFEQRPSASSSRLGTELSWREAQAQRRRELSSTRKMAVREAPTTAYGCSKAGLQLPNVALRFEDRTAAPCPWLQYSTEYLRIKSRDLRVRCQHRARRLSIRWSTPFTAAPLHFINDG
jgi:hypothetical protein